jgi:ribonuclease III
LAQFAINLHLGKYLRMGHGESDSGGRDRPATLCAGFEALIAAIYLDQGIECVRDFILPLITPELDRIQQGVQTKDAKSRLQEWSQGHWNLTPEYRTVQQHGPEHAKEFVIEAWIGDQSYGQGNGRSKQIAAQAAAARALERLEAEELAALSLQTLSDESDDAIVPNAQDAGDASADF